MMDTTDLNKLAEAATPGPWKADGVDRCCAQVSMEDRPWTVVAAVTDVYPECVIHMRPEDAMFIAAANPAVVLELITERDKMRETLGNCREFIMADAKVRRMLDETGEVSPLFPLRKAVLASIDAAVSKEAQS